MKKQMHRLLSLMLSLILVVGMIPGSLMTAQAAENTGDIDDFNIKVGKQFILNPDYEMSGTGNLGGTWEYSNNYADNIPTVKLDNYKSDNGWIQLYDASPEGAVRFRIIVSGDCEITANEYAIILQANTNGYLYIWFDDNATLTINGGGGIYNYTNDPQTRIESHFGRDCNGTLTINATKNAAIWSMKQREAAYSSDGCLSVSDGVTLNTNGSIHIGTNFVRRYDPDRWEVVNVDLCVENNATVYLKNPEFQGQAYNSLSQMYPFTKWSPAIQVVENEGSVVHIYTPRFVNQTPAGSYSETTGQNVMVGEPQTYTFNSNTAPTGYYVEKTATLKGLFAGLDADKTVTVTDGSAVTINHTFVNAGLYQLTETLKLYKDGKDTPAATKTHVFLISVSEKPLVTPTITQQPTSVIKATGDSVTLTAKAENAERARWYVEKADGTVAALGDALTDGTSTQTISKASNAAGNRYFCAFWSEDDKIAKTDSVTVCFVPTVTSNGNVTVASGNTAFLKVTESGCGHYADANGWYKDGVELTSGDKYYIMGTTLAVQNAAAEDEGTYTYKYVTDHGDVVTADVALTVNTGSSSVTIDTFDIFGLDNPMILGTVADTEVSVPDDANYTVESVTCTFANGSGVVTSANGSVSIKLKAKSGYTFASGDLAGTVEGIYKTVYSVPANATEITVTVDYNNYSSWKIAYPANDTISISTDSLTFKVGTAANGQKVEGAFNCTHSGLADTNLHHTGMKYAVYSIADNAMPAGLTLNADGTITGTPTTAGVYTVMVRADSVNANGTASNCSGLAVKAIEIIVESDAHIHDWDLENPVSDSATCTADGVKVISCKNGCGETITVTSSATGHDWTEWNDGNPIITPPCTADSDLVITRTCNNTNCPVGTESKTISRIHMAMGWTTDATDHWKVCTYGCGTIVVEKENHTDADSNKKCDTCEYDMTPAVAPTKIDSITIEGLPAPQYGMGIQEYDDNVLVEKIKNGSITVNGQVCVDDAFGNIWFDGARAFNKDENVPEDYYTGAKFEEDTYYLGFWFMPATGYTFADDLSATVDGVNNADVSIKDAEDDWIVVWIKYEITAPSSAPTEYNITVTGGTASANKAVAGTVITLTVDESAIPAGKVFDKWEVVSGGVTVTDGKFTMPANAVEINATYKDAPVSHTCDIKPVAKDEPSCTEGGKEAYYKCEGCGKFYEDALGAKEITDLANWGNLPKLGHTESDWKSDKDNHWKECTVTACGVIIEDSKAAHKDDNKDGKCDVCEYNVGLPTTPDDDKPNDNPQTGDNSNMFLWIALLFISGAGVVATTVFGKKKFSVK